MQASWLEFSARILQHRLSLLYFWFMPEEFCKGLQQPLTTTSCRRNKESWFVTRWGQDYVIRGNRVLNIFLNIILHKWISFLKHACGRKSYSWIDMFKVLIQFKVTPTFEKSLYTHIKGQYFQSLPLLATCIMVRKSILQEYIN